MWGNLGTHASKTMQSAPNATTPAAQQAGSRTFNHLNSWENSE